MKEYRFTEYMINIFNKYVKETCPNVLISEVKDYNTKYILKCNGDDLLLMVYNNKSHLVILYNDKNLKNEPYIFSTLADRVSECYPIRYENTNSDLNMNNDKQFELGRIIKFKNDVLINTTIPDDITLEDGNILRVFSKSTKDIVFKYISKDIYKPNGSISIESIKIADIMLDELIDDYIDKYIINITKFTSIHNIGSNLARFLLFTISKSKLYDITDLSNYNRITNNPSIMSSADDNVHIYGIDTYMSIFIRKIDKLEYNILCDTIVDFLYHNSQLIKEDEEE